MKTMKQIWLERSCQPFWPSEQTTKKEGVCMIYVNSLQWIYVCKEEPNHLHLPIWCMEQQIENLMCWSCFCNIWIIAFFHPASVSSDLLCYISFVHFLQTSHLRILNANLVTVCFMYAHWIHGLFQITLLPNILLFRALKEKILYSHFKAFFIEFDLKIFLPVVSAVLNISIYCKWSELKGCAKKYKC